MSSWVLTIPLLLGYLILTHDLDVLYNVFLSYILLEETVSDLFDFKWLWSCSTAEFGTTCHLNGICGPSGSCLCNDLWEGHGSHGAWDLMGCQTPPLTMLKTLDIKCIHLQSCYNHLHNPAPVITKLSWWHFPHFSTQTRSFASVLGEGCTYCTFDGLPEVGDNTTSYPYPPCSTRCSVSFPDVFLKRFP